MTYERIIKNIIQYSGTRSPASIYISIIIGYLERKDWQSALFFYKKAISCSFQLEEQLLLDVLYTIIFLKDIPSFLLLKQQLKMNPIPNDKSHEEE